MKLIASSLGGLLFYSSHLAMGQGVGPPPDKIQPQLEPELKSFFAAKAEQAKTLATDLNLTVVPDFNRYFEAAARGDWKQVNDLYQKVARRTGQYAPDPAAPRSIWKKAGDFLQKLADQSGPSFTEADYRNPVWQTVNETSGAYEAFAIWEPDHLRLFAREIINPIPPGSIYFGGTDPGRYLITAFSKSHSKADPFFTLSQNPLADVTYLRYLRAMYGAKIYIPSDEDSQAAFQDYMNDAARRLQHDNEFPDEPKQLKPGESIVYTQDGRVQVSGQIAVMAINARLAKVIWNALGGRQPA